MYDVTSEYVGLRYVTAPSRAITRARSSSSHSTTMQTNSAIPYPPTAILPSGAEIPGPHTTSQPNHVPQMQIAGGKHAPPEKQGNAERLRGGCVPCPVSSCSFGNLVISLTLCLVPGRFNLLDHTDSVLLLLSERMYYRITRA